MTALNGLTRITLCDILTLCHNNSGYKTAIVFGTREQAAEFAAEISSLHGYAPIAGVAEISVNKNAAQILFKNKSAIHILVFSAAHSWQDYQYILYDESLDTGSYLNILQESANPKPDEPSFPNGDTPLDNFLRSFRITHNPSAHL